MINKKNGILAGIFVIAVIGIVWYGKTADQKLVDQSKGEIQWMDSSQKEVDVTDSEAYRQPYFDTAYEELLGIIQEKEGCTEEEAKDKVNENNWSITTSYDDTIQKALWDSVRDHEADIDGNLGIEINDTAGRVAACVSYGNSKNYILERTYAASTIKPLSVYGPAVADGSIDWTTTFPDQAYTMVEDSSGNLTAWPKNAGAESNGEEYTAADALKKSLNTIAVEVLKQYGVEKSCNFLESAFEMNLDAERAAMQENGEDEILGNIALGYVRNGVTVKEMCGYYQVFANGGTYCPSHTILSVSCGADEYYSNQENSKHVFTPQVSYVMNRMMKRVLEEGGTAQSAAVDGYDIVGKTGTTDDYKDNWFIGCTPHYVCAVWNGKSTGVKNAITKVGFLIYDDVIQKIEEKDVQFEMPEGVEERDGGYYITED